MIVNIIVFLFVLGLLILVHELGHFLAAKMVGIKVEEFGIGFAPRLWSFKKGDTVYSINWIPFGGFVKLKGMFDEGEQRSADSFAHASVWARMLVVVSGVLMNLALAWVLLFGGYLVGFSPATQDLASYRGAQVVKEEVVLAGLVEGLPAAQAGLEAGDIFVSVDNQPVKRITDLQQLTQNRASQQVEITVNRIGEVKQFSVSLSGPTDAPLGVELYSSSVIKLPFLSAIKGATMETYGLTKAIFTVFVDIIKDLFSQGEVPEGVSGPVGIYRATSMAAQVGLTALLSLVILLTINLAIINILPFPALDGGYLFFLVLEAVFGRKIIKNKVEAFLTTFGFMFLILILIIMTYRDFAQVG